MLLAVGPDQLVEAFVNGARDLLGVALIIGLARGIQRDWRMILRGLDELVGRKPGWLRKMGRAYLSYYRPDFHPWQRDTTAAMNHWKQVYGIS